MRRLLAIAILSTFVWVALHAPASAEGTFVDKKNGFQVKAPSGWAQIPIKVEEKWICAKWQCDKEYEGKEGFSHTPLLRVILFEKAGGGEAASEGGEPAKPAEGGVVSLDAPYLDYKDYLKRNFSEGGFFVSAEDNGKIGNTPVTMIEVKVEKLAMTGKKRIMAWIFHAPFGDLAIEGDSLEEKFDKLKPIYLAAFKSFRVIERDASLQGEEIDTGASISFGGKDETPEERKKRRMEAQEKVFKKALADLPKDWTSKRTPHFLVINHGKPQFMDKVIAHAEAVRTWLDQRFGDVGDGYVQDGILRICKDSDEERAFGKSSGDAYSSETREIVLSGGNDFSKDWEFDSLGTAILRQYFSDKDEMLYSSMPPWLENGLSRYIGSAKLKGKSLEFAADQSEQDGMREGRRANALLPVKDMFAMSSNELWQGEGGMALYAECASIVRYLYGPGAKQPKTRNLIRDYIAKLLAVVEEQDAAAEEARKNEAPTAAPQTEEEEEAEFKKRRNKNWTDNEKDLLKKVFEKVFEGWTDGDWQSLQTAWEKWAK